MAPQSFRAAFQYLPNGAVQFDLTIPGVWVGGNSPRSEDFPPRSVLESTSNTGLPLARASCAWVSIEEP